MHDPINGEQQDILDRRFLAERIFNRLVDESCPHAIGVYGNWGTGKTSLLNLILEKWNISGNKIVHLEYIDAWNYEGTANLFVPVIVRMMSNRLAFIPDWAEYFKRISTIALYMGTDIVLRNLTGGITQGDLKNYEADMKSTGLTRVSVMDWEKLSDTVEETQAAFKKLIDDISKKESSRKIVFLIDNLDRCSPENTVTLLESIKNFLTIDGCVWVFAMDSDVISSYIDRKYDGTKMDGVSYLDKIIPEQYHLSFLPEENDPRIFNLIYDVTGGVLTLNDEKRLPQIPRVLVPRRLKKSAEKFANYFDGTNPDADRDTIFLLCLLYHAWPEFYGRLSSPSIQHVGGILANFFKDDGSTQQNSIWEEYLPFSIDKKFSDDSDLKYFLRVAFPDYRVGLDLVRTIHRAVNGLRQIGLP